MGCPPPISEYRETWPSNEELDIMAGFLGHHCTSKHHCVLVGNSYTTCNISYIIYKIYTFICHVC